MCHYSVYNLKSQYLHHSKIYTIFDILLYVNIEYIFVVLLVVLISLIFHEIMHAYTSFWLGDDTAKLEGRLTFNPIKHIDPFLTILLPITLAIANLPVFGGAKPVPYNPNNVRWGEWGSALIALAGPITNLLLAFILFGFWVLAGLPSTGLVGQIFETAIVVNLGFFIFNMIPFPPLDGSRVLYALAPEFARRLMEMLERFGILFIFLMIMFTGPSIGRFILYVINFFLSIFSRIYGV